MRASELGPDLPLFASGIVAAAVPATRTDEAQAGPSAQNGSAPITSQTLDATSLYQPQQHEKTQNPSSATLNHSEADVEPAPIPAPNPPTIEPPTTEDRGHSSDAEADVHYDGYADVDPPTGFPRPGHGLARTLPPEQEDLQWLVDDNYDVYSHYYQSDPQGAHNGVFGDAGDTGDASAGQADDGGGTAAEAMDLGREARDGGAGDEDAKVGLGVLEQGNGDGDATTGGDGDVKMVGDGVATMPGAEEGS